MQLVSALRPRRALVLPAATVAAPLAYFVLRDAGAAGSVGLEHAALLCGSLAAGYLAAAGVCAAIDPERFASANWLVRRAVSPDVPTLAVFGPVVVGAAAYLATRLTVGVPPVVSTLLTPVGTLLGLPLVVLYGGLVVVGNAAGSEPALAWQSVVVGIGVALSVLWTFALCASLTRLVARSE